MCVGILAYLRAHEYMHARVRFSYIHIYIYTYVYIYIYICTIVPTHGSDDYIAMRPAFLALGAKQNTGRGSKKNKKPRAAKQILGVFCYTV